MNNPRGNRVFFSGHWFFFCVVISLVQVLSHGAAEVMSTNIGAIIDLSSRTGKEQKTAMEIAVKSFNNASNHHKLTLHIRDSSANPLEAATAAQEMIRDKEVKVIVGMETWEEAALVGDVGSKAQVPVLSFAGPSTSSQSAATRWPYLVRMEKDDSEQMKCIASVIDIFGWKRVTVIYQEDAYGSDSGKFALLSEALQNVSSEIEYRMVLPSTSSVQQELRKLVQSTQSRVFVVLRSSLPMAIRLFEEARKVELMGGDSAWIVTDTISSYLDSFNTSVIKSMEGILGVKKHYSENSISYRHFRSKFIKRFVHEYEEEHSPEPGIDALIAYDSIKIVAGAIRGLSNGGNNGKELLRNILGSKLSGLSGEIWFSDQGRTLEGGPRLQLVNVVGNKYKELNFWDPAIKGFRSELRDSIIWSGDLKIRSVPKGWAMPTEAKQLVIVVPATTSFTEFVKAQNGTSPTGFCIDLFNKVLDILDYKLHFKFVTRNDSYDNLVQGVYDKTYDAAVGDFTILANRTNDVEFTQPYAESSLSMIFPAKSEMSAWMFLRPFTLQMWLVTLGILLYTVIVVWFLENKINPEYGGPLERQFATALWFTCSSLFFAHKEKVYSNFTRVVVIVWLFVVIVLTSSYTANLSSMLTVRRLESDERTDIEWLKRENKMVGCDGDSFVRSYLENVLDFPPQNIKSVSGENNFEGELRSGNIAAAFLELPYTNVFIRHYCKKFISTPTSVRFGGLGFVFQKGSPIATDISRAILQLSEDGILKKLEDEAFRPSLECSPNSREENQTDRLTVNSFWGLYLLSGVTSTICFLLSLIRLLFAYRREKRHLMMAETLWNKASRLLKFLCFGESAIHGGRRSPEVLHGWEVSDPNWELVSPSEIALGSRGSPACSENGMRTSVENGIMLS